jgi:hypothetical protein
MDIDIVLFISTNVCLNLFGSYVSMQYVPCYLFWLIQHVHERTSLYIYGIPSVQPQVACVVGGRRIDRRSTHTSLPPRAGPLVRGLLNSLGTALFISAVAHSHSVLSLIGLETAMGTQNPSTRRVLSDKETGMKLYFYPRIHKWATSCTHRVSGCGCGYILPIPAYPRVK